MSQTIYSLEIMKQQLSVSFDSRDGVTGIIFNNTGYTDGRVVNLWTGTSSHARSLER